MRRERNAFLTLLERALPPAKSRSRRRSGHVRKIAIRPMASEATETETIVAASMGDLDAVLDAVAQRSCPAIRSSDCSAWSTGLDIQRRSADALSATARTPCWAINLVATRLRSAFRLSEKPLPFPGLVQRRLFRADRDATNGAPPRARVCSMPSTPPPAKSPASPRRRNLRARISEPAVELTAYRSPGCCCSAIWRPHPGPARPRAPRDQGRSRQATSTTRSQASREPSRAVRNLCMRDYDTHGLA
jgi:hypothetical protein